MPPKAKYYLYIDETGQHTRGEMFVVAVACFEGVNAQSIADTLTHIEEVKTNKGLRKWVRTPIAVRRLFLQEVVSIARQGKIKFYYKIYSDGTDYLPRTRETIAAAIRAHQPQLHADLIVVVDGLNSEGREVVRRTLRRHSFPYSRTVRGGRDESSPYIRLVDSMAGFVRHAYLREPYTQECWEQFRPYLQKL